MSRGRERFEASLGADHLGVHNCYNSSINSLYLCIALGFKLHKNWNIQNLEKMGNLK